MWTREQVLGASHAWQWVPPGAEELQIDDVLVIDYPEWARMASMRTLDADNRWGMTARPVGACGRSRQVAREGLRSRVSGTSTRLVDPSRPLRGRLLNLAGHSTASAVVPMQ